MKIWVLDHLQGRLPLGRVFWLHGMALRLLMYASLSAIGWSTRPWFWFLIPLLLLELGLFVWQLIGFPEVEMTMSAGLETSPLFGADTLHLP